MYNINLEGFLNYFQHSTSYKTTPKVEGFLNYFHTKNINL